MMGLCRMSDIFVSDVSIDGQVLVSAVVAAGAGKAVGKDAAFQILLEGLAHIGLGAVMVALAGKLAQGEILESFLFVQQASNQALTPLALSTYSSKKFLVIDDV